jgi:hypothetical protein
VLHLLPHRLQVVEDGIRLGRLLERLALLNPFEPIAQPVENVTHRPHAGQVVGRVALAGLQRLEHFRRRPVGVTPGRLQFRVHLRVRFDQLANIRSPLGVAVFPTGTGAGREVLQTANALTQFVQSLIDGLAAPPEAPFRLAGVAAAPFEGDFGEAQSPLMTREALGSPLQQRIDSSLGVVHDAVLGGRVPNQRPIISCRTRFENLNRVNYFLPLA